eukprot:CAMPEP_0184039560 /NCGR_PEP_ID=MMETSP0955-20130417/53314_1 /TAXON_ID=627963 /ORGANISM="Aplanochytrium sp, Strain PBS07" /LENGTH=549 /DNA_ID=CAMNT_0026328829 /DNA_START=149 /DNA_END=1798 /DNA_ORIENTATION=+
MKTHKLGKDVLLDPKLNKGSGFTHQERKHLKIHGLVPHAVETLELQLERELRNLRMKPNDLEKYVYLMELLNRNETLFYRLVVDNIKECMPLVYTPTVGAACESYSHIFSQPKGIYISIKDKGNVKQILENWPTKNVKAIVFTDGERILGLGDLGINGMGIPVGKLQLYSACAGIPPSQCLPVVIDNGTETEKYLKDPLYMGLKQKRVRGKEFNDLIEEFMSSCQQVFGPSVLLQFEDFGNSTAFGLLEQTRDRYTTFNDDIQGTACVALAGVIASLKINGAPSKLADHRILFFGAGEAGIGIGSLIAYAISHEDGVSEEQARKNIWFVDSQGLITEQRHKTSSLKHHKVPFAHDASAYSGDLVELEDIVKSLKPTMIVGVSAQPGKFTEGVIRAMADINQVPIIFALSNPTHKCECTAQEAYDYTNQRCVFASGSPFGTVSSGGKTFEPGQGNNAYIFPGLALGVIAAKAKKIPESLFYETAVCLAGQVTKDDYARGSIYPKLERIREVSFNIAVGVAQSCYKLNLAREKKHKHIDKYIRSKITNFHY